MKFSTSVWILPLLVILVLSVALAQDQPTKLKRFRTLSWKSDLGDIYFTQSTIPIPTADNPTPTPAPNYQETLLQVPSAFRSPFYKYDPSKPVEFVRHVGGKIVLIGSLDLLNGPNLPLLFFLPGKSDGSFTIQVINDDPTKFPGGSFMCFNFSRVSVTPKFTNLTGVTMVAIPPDSTQLLKPTFDPQQVTSFKVLVGNEGRICYSSSWSIASDLRYLLFFVDNPTHPNAVQFVRVGDRLEDLVEAKPTP